MKKYLSWLSVYAMLFALSCTSQTPVKTPVPADTGSGAALDEGGKTAPALQADTGSGAAFDADIKTAPAPQADTGDGLTLDEALSEIASYYTAALPANTPIALVGFESEAQLLSDYIFEELWIHFEDSASFLMIDRKNLERIRGELEYQYSGEVSEGAAQSAGKQFGARILLYGKITRLDREYRLVINATDVEKAITSIRSAVVKPDHRFAALLENPSGGSSGIGMAKALYSGADNPWRFTAQTDKGGGDYHDGDYMTVRIYSERDAYIKVTHIDVNGRAQVIYPASPRDDNFIKAGETRQIPDNTRFRMTKPYGEEMILAGAYEKPFAFRPAGASPVSNAVITRGLVVESLDTQTDMRPAATAKIAYRIEP